MRAIDESLLPLGTLFPRVDLAASIQLAARNPDDAVDFLRRHRVVGLGLRRLRSDGLAVSFPEPLARLHAWRESLDNLLIAGQAELEGAIQATQVGIFGIKGLAMRGQYAHAQDRDVGDLDIMVSNVDEAWQLASYLRTRGYDWCEYEWPWLKRDKSSSVIYGQFQVWKPAGEHYLRFDIHFGGYSVRHCRLADWPDTASGFQIASLVANLPCLLGNAGGDFLIRLKDVNDVAVMLRSETLDADSVVSTVRRLGLERFWNTLLYRVANLSELTVSERIAAQRLSIAGVRRQRVPFGSPSRGARTFATTLDAARFGREARGVVDGVRAGFGAFRYYRRKMAIEVGKCVHTAASDLVATMSNETCVRLIPPRMLRQSPASHAMPLTPSSGLTSKIEGSRSFTEVIANEHSFVDADGERFVPTVHYRLCTVEAAGGWSAEDEQSRL